MGSERKLGWERKDLDSDLVDQGNGGLKPTWKPIVGVKELKNWAFEPWEMKKFGGGGTGEDGR